MLNVPQHRRTTGSRPLHHNPKYFLLLITFGCALLVADYSITKQFAPSLFEAVTPALARRSGGISPTHPAKLADGCYHIFLDVGANIGVHSRFLFEPDKYPDAERAHGIFDSEFGDSRARDNRDMCAFAFEPNPKHASRHQALEEAYKQQGWRYHYIAAAVSNAEGNITFYHNHENMLRNGALVIMI